MALKPPGRGGDSALERCAGPLPVGAWQVTPSPPGRHAETTIMLRPYQEATSVQRGQTPARHK